MLVVLASKDAVSTSAVLLSFLSEHEDPAKAIAASKAIKKYLFNFVFFVPTIYQLLYFYYTFL
jgi:hypothetical protein